jgi:hypothetical protein
MTALPPVSRCEVSNCFYNQDQGCHAPAINVGGAHPSCDTFVADASHIHRADGGMVGACMVTDCRFNAERTCQASAIQVSGHAGHADCATFVRR